MSDLLILAAMLAIVVALAVAVSRLTPARTVDLHVAPADLTEALTWAPTWSFREPCHLCAARLTDAAHYIGGGRVLCPSCADAAKAVAA